MPSAPELSVVMPLYNNAEHFSMAIESILSQSFRNFECIVIDDASQDGSPALLRSYARKDVRIRAIFLKKNEGLMRVSQIGLEQARAPLIARMDSDDLSLPTRFERQIDFMKQHPEVGMVGCSYFRFKDDPDHKRLNIRLPSFAKLSSRSFSYRAARLKLCVASGIYRREIALAVGGYRAFFKNGAEDRDFVLRLQERAKFVNLPEFFLQIFSMVTGRILPVFLYKTEVLCMRRTLWESYAPCTDATAFPTRSIRRSLWRSCRRCWACLLVSCWKICNGVRYG